ncbi:ComF family protein [bacterium]|nr:ComF family protein [bacterium]
MKPRPFLERALDWLYPPSCPGCGSEGYGFCEKCRCGIVPQHEKLGSGLEVHAAGLYGQELRSALLQTKMLGYTYYIYALAEAMLRAIPERLRGKFPVSVVPIPPSKRRLRRRGYHCPYLLGRELVRQEAAFVYRPDLLSLTRELAEQKTLSRAQRFANVKNAYAANGGRGLYVLLVDDVLTTGASVYEAAQALYRSGAMRVEVSVLGLRKR